MSTIKMHATTKATPEQYVAALTDFGAGRSKIFGNSADNYLKVHESRAGHADVTEGSGGVWERLVYDWSDPLHVEARTIDSNIWGGHSGHTYRFARNADGTTEIDYVVVRDGKNLKGHFLGFVLGTVGKSKLVKAFRSSVNAVEARKPGEGNPIVTLLRKVSAGALAGAGGTAAMDLLLYRRYRHDGGKDSLGRWEFAADVMSWDDTSAPGQLARKALRPLIGDEPPDEWARPATNIVHWATGVGWGVVYAALPATTPRRSWVRALALGPVAWLSGYVVLPLAKVYKPIWRYDARTLAKDLSAHLVFGAAASTVFAGSRRRHPDLARRSSIKHTVKGVS